MQKCSMNTEGWDSFWKRWGDTISRMPGRKEEMLEKIGTRMQEAVQSAVDRAGINDAHGRVKRWQNPHVGSGNGYVAVRADSEKVPAGYKHKGTVNAGALTNFLTSGHRVRPPSGRWRQYKPRFGAADTRGSARMTRVQGYEFYEKARAEAEKAAIQEVESFLKKLAETELQL